MGQTFEGGVAIVAGGSGGIGSVICEKLAGAGTHVALTYRSRPEAAEKVVDAIRAKGREAFAQAVDHSDPDAMKAFVDAAAKKLGRVHSVVYAAGPHLPLNFVNRSEERRVGNACVSTFRSRLSPFP